MGTEGEGVWEGGGEGKGGCIAEIRGEVNVVFQRYHLVQKLENNASRRDCAREIGMENAESVRMAPNAELAGVV